MGRKLVAVYTILSILSLVGIVSFFLYRVSTYRTARILEAKAFHSTLRKMVEEGINQEQSFQSSLLREKIREVFQKNPSLQLMLVYTFDEGIHYLQVRSPEVLNTPIQELDSIRGFPQIHYNRSNFLKITSSIAQPPQNTYLFDTVYQLLNPSELWPMFRDTLLMLLLLAFISTVVYLANKGTPSAKPSIPAVDTSAPPKGDTSANSTVPAQPLPTRAETLSSAPSSAELILSTNAEQCLFSPNTGLGWEQHLEKRLTLELERAAYNEQDLTLILIRVPGLNRTMEGYKTLAKAIQSSLSFEDLVFEYKDEGIAVVIPNSSLEQSTTLLKGFLKKLDPSFSNTYSVPRCGLSSRNGRLLEGKLLLKEAESSLEKAGSTWKDCIVGFRSDPGKYREYLTRKTVETPAEPA